MHNPSCAMTQFHSDPLGAHCQFAEGTLFHNSALLGLAALANTSTVKNKKNAPNPTANPSIASFYMTTLLFVSQQFHSHNGTMLCRLSLLKERENTEGKSCLDCESTRPAVGTHGPIHSSVSAPKSSAARLWEHISDGLAAGACRTRGHHASCSLTSSPAWSLPPQLGTTDAALTLSS